MLNLQCLFLPATIFQARASHYLERDPETNIYNSVCLSIHRFFENTQGKQMKFLPLEEAIQLS